MNALLYGNLAVSIILYSNCFLTKVYSSVFPSLNFNEDLFWGKYVAANEKDFKIPLIIIELLKGILIIYLLTFINFILAFTLKPIVASFRF